MRFCSSLCILALALACSACGYHVAGKADLIPEHIHTIAIPAFTNLSVRYKISDRLPEAIAREFIARTRYRVVPDQDKADAILRGAVLNYVAYPTIFDQTTGRATGLQINLTMQISLVERATGKVIFNRPSYDAHQRYELSLDPTKYFDESDIALQRLSNDVARDLVTAILENF